MLIVESAMQQSGVCYRRLPLLLVPPKGLWQTSDFFFIIKVKAVDARNKLPHPLSTWGEGWGKQLQSRISRPAKSFSSRSVDVPNLEYLLTPSLTDSSTSSSSYDNCLVNAVWV